MKISISMASGPGPHLDMEQLMALGPGPHLDMELMMALGPGPHLDMDPMTQGRWTPGGIHCCAPSRSWHDRCPRGAKWKSISRQWHERCPRGVMKSESSQQPKKAERTSPKKISISMASGPGPHLAHSKMNTCLVTHSHGNSRCCCGAVADIFDKHVHVHLGTGMGTRPPAPLQT